MAKAYPRIINLFFILPGLAFLMVSCQESPVELNPSDSILEIRETAQDVLFPFQEGWSHGYLYQDGSWAIAPQYKDVRPFSEGLAAVKGDSSWGYIDEQNELVVDFQFEKAGKFEEGLASVMLRGKYGFINREGVLMIGANFYRAWAFSEGIAMIRMGELIGFIDQKGYLVADPSFLWALPFSEGYAVVADTSGLFGFLRKDGTYLAKPQFERAWSFKEGLAAATENGFWGYIDSSALFVDPPVWDECWSYSEGRGLIRKGSVWGYLALDGSTAIIPQYDDAWDFSDGLAAVRVDSLWGFIDPTGKMAIEPQFTSVGHFDHGLALMEGQPSFYINKFGERLVPGESPEDAVATVVDTITTAEPVAVVTASPVNFKLEVNAAWKNRELALGRHTANTIADEWATDGDAMLVLWGQQGRTLMAVEVYDPVNQPLEINLAIVSPDGKVVRHPLISPGIERNSANKELIRSKILSNIWYWDGEKIIPSRLKKHDYEVVEDGITLSWQGKEWRWELSPDGWEVKSI